MTDINDIFNEFARVFAGTISDNQDVAFSDQLPRALLDGTVDSLHHVDRYLEFVHRKRRRVTEQEWHLTVLRAGAYLGEVIRHAPPRGFFSWIDYNDYMPTHPKLQGIIPERTTATCAMLVARDGSMSMPLNKVARFIEDGKENSLHFFAVCDLAKVTKCAV